MTWGDWMGSCKTVLDEEAERIDRQKAAFGGDTVARIKDLNVLIVGCQGVGVETAKNLILSNVGAVVLYDPVEATVVDRGTNFYIREEHCAQPISRAEASLAELKTLNPYCKVDVLNASSSSDDATTLLTTECQNPNVLLTGKPYAAIVVTQPLPRPLAYQLNEMARSHHIAFVWAVTTGVTCSIFSDFGPNHEISDPFGEPTQLLAIRNIEVLHQHSSLLRVNGLKKEDDSTSVVVVITTAQADHGLDDGDVVVLDDMRDTLQELNSCQFTVQRAAFVSPTAAAVDTQDVSFKELLKYPTETLMGTLEKQYAFYEKEHAAADKKMPVRTITMFNRLALVLPKDSPYIPLFESYTQGGLLNQVRQPVIKSYHSLSETVVNTTVPQMLRGEDWEDGKGIDVHLSMAAVWDFHEKQKRWPGLHDEDDAEQVVKLAQQISDQRAAAEGKCWAQKVSFGFPSGEARSIDETRVRRYAELFRTELTGFCAFLGGAAAQEVLKKTGKFTPINQWIHHDEHVLVADESTSNVQPLFGSRYDYQMAIMGKDFQAQAANQRVFLVGCGALGCEYLKGLSLMGVGTGRHGKIYVTDMDRIEVSNLSRQFLFRDADVGNPKSVSGARVVKSWNPQMNITALEKRVGTDSEDFFDDSFWESLNVCWNALDNVMARKYTDAQCLFYSKPLLESGTLGTKCNHEVILPYRTSSYNDGKESDDNENQIAMCTLRSFPYLPLHCIEFAKQAYFSDYFEFGPEQYETFRNDISSFFEQLDSMEAGEQLKSLKAIHYFVRLQKGGSKIDFSTCVRIAFERMMEDFRTSILNLLYAADEMEKSEGKPFWTGTKRRPRAVDWGTGNLKEVAPELMEYLYCCANMYAHVWGVEHVRDRAEFENAVENLHLQQPEWSPSSDSVDLSEGDQPEGGVDEAAEAEKLKAELYQIDVSKLLTAVPHDFEKDDDSNFHIDFLTIATNLRAWVYDIKLSQRHTVKVTAGRIIPALATTTAMVCGLVDIEFCKLVLGLQSMGKDKFLNSNINLAAGSGNFTTYSPDPPIPLKTGLKTPDSFSSWDKIEISTRSVDGSEMTVESLVRFIENSFGVTVDRVFEFGTTKDQAIYKAVDKTMLDWDITVGEDGKPVVSEGVFSRWPQIRMAVQMLGRLPASSAQRKVFEKQVDTIKQSLDKTKESFAAKFNGPVSVAYRDAYRPDEDGSPEQTYFDALFARRDYIKLAVHCRTDDEPDVHLPCIKYVFDNKEAADPLENSPLPSAG